MTVREVAAMRQIHSQNLIAVLDCRKVNGHVRLGATVRLYVCMIGAEDLFCAIYSCLFDYVCPLATAVVTFLRIPFGVLVCKNGTRRFQHCLADKVFRSD